MTNEAVGDKYKSCQMSKWHFVVFGTNLSLTRVKTESAVVCLFDCKCVHVSECLCVCVCVREKERENERERMREIVKCWVRFQKSQLHC